MHLAYMFLLFSACIQSAALPENLTDKLSAELNTHSLHRRTPPPRSRLSSSPSRLTTTSTGSTSYDSLSSSGKSSIGGTTSSSGVALGATRQRGTNPSTTNGALFQSVPFTKGKVIERSPSPKPQLNPANRERKPKPSSSDSQSPARYIKLTHKAAEATQEAESARKVAHEMVDTYHKRISTNRVMSVADHEQLESFHQQQSTLATQIASTSRGIGKTYTRSQSTWLKAGQPLAAAHTAEVSSFAMKTGHAWGRESRRQRELAAQHQTSNALDEVRHAALAHPADAHVLAEYTRLLAERENYRKRAQRQGGKVHRSKMELGMRGSPPGAAREFIGLPMTTSSAEGLSEHSAPSTPDTASSDGGGSGSRRKMSSSSSPSPSPLPSLPLSASPASSSGEQRSGRL